MRRVGLAAVTTAVALAAWAGSASAATYSNPTPLGPADNAPLLPYPSPIVVAGEQGTTLNVTATLIGVANAEASQLDALLVGPGGRSILVSDSCWTGGLVPSWTGQDLTFDDNAAARIPEICTSIPDGTFKPADYDGADNFPGQSPPYPTGLAVFRGISPNGLWSLYVVDDGAGDNLRITGGWRLSVTTTSEAPRCKGEPATIPGTEGDDELSGGPGRDVIAALGGKDEIRGLAGKDLICGGKGKDILRGGKGKDKLYGQGGKDKLSGGGGKDRCVGGKKDDSAKKCEVEKSI